MGVAVTIGGDHRGEALLQQRPGGRERLGVTVEIGQGAGELEMDRLQRVLKPGEQGVGGLAPHHRRDQGLGPLFHHDRQLAHAEPPETADLVPVF